ncbi:glycine cleavage system aminomethyltransferase GcvT [Rhodobacter sp. KR11]|uniref:glycine cleavage system aminomethyltransferase GcvT n=1 Tax=Rhodobacter sp. KR11 TaxID=2974588 RepID=UPI0022218193|nr:glycine cleavage system aminomethyltransferase GcvT [Rhodobacter sp. KR11]MCW1918449.1 glycine cleavage system aminomethyltransferase GcvT [Rhodobacter sp. KR11]
MQDDLLKLGLDGLHRAWGGRMVPFAGYDMPVQYADGVLKEHLATRAGAGLFDVSHMGQVILRPKTSLAELCLAFESLVPADVLDLGVGRQRYGLFTDAKGGILDDLMFANRGDHLFVVVNAACKAADIAHMKAHLSAVAEVLPQDRALLALQGPGAEAILDTMAPGAAKLRFMDVAYLDWDGVELWVSRSGYTGEDGYEISLPQARAEAFARALVTAGAQPIGLGARDSLRLEAGLCLYGHDIDRTTSPIEAALSWAIPKSRRKGGEREGGFPGAERILREIELGPERLRVGLAPEGRAPMREGVELFQGSDPVGRITSGGFGPSVAAPIAMGYVPLALSKPGTRLEAELRGKRLPVTVTTLPFHPTTYKR